MISDLMLHQLRETEIELDRATAVEIAVGQIDGASRYLHGEAEDEIAAEVRRAAAE